MKRNRWPGLIPVLILSCLSMQGQKIGSWKSYQAYQNASQIAETPNRVFAVYDGALLSYSTEDQSVQTYSLPDGLNDSDIRFIRYSPETKTLLIVYDNSNIDLFLGKNNVYNLADIKNNSTLSNRVINHVEIQGEYAYLSTGYGVVVVDMKKRVIKDNYRLYINTMASCEWNGYRYAATSNGLLRASLSSELSDVTNWEKVNLNRINGKNLSQMLVFQDRLVVYDQANMEVWSLSVDGVENQLSAGGLCRQLSVCNNQLIMVFWASIMRYDDWETPAKKAYFDENLRFISSQYAQGNYWIAWGERGLVKGALKTVGESNQLEYETILSGINVNSPLRNLIYQFTFTQNQLLVTGGNRGYNPSGFPGTFMIYKNKQWTNLDDRAVSLKTGLTCLDLIAAVADPRDPNHYFVSSWGQGLYEFQDTTLLNLYSLNNSTLISMPNTPPEKWVMLDGLAFDRNNNLYALNTRVSTQIHILSPDGKWYGRQYSDLLGTQIDKLIITRDNKKWISSFRIKPSIFVLDDKATIADPSDDQVYYAERFVDQQNRLVEISTYTCLAEDLNGTVWVGTDNGPITFSSAEQVGRGECYRPVGVDQYQRGHYLLEGQKVTCIAVDGSNRKWIGTNGSGVFLVDQSDGLTVQNFNTGNSEILSDMVTALAISDQTGEVFIGTNRGICSYQGDAIAGKPDYSEVRAFPNPVYPLRHNQVTITGLMQNSRIKITDSAGNLIKEAVSNGGQYTWNCTTSGGEVIKAGIYLVFATLSDGSQGMVTKIMAIK